MDDRYRCVRCKRWTRQDLCAECQEGSRFIGAAPKYEQRDLGVGDLPPLGMTQEMLPTGREEG